MGNLRLNKTDNGKQLRFLKTHIPALDIKINAELVHFNSKQFKHHNAILILRVVYVTI